jgi:hypothetical protein
VNKLLENELLNDWLTTLYSSFEKNKQEIRELERKMDYFNRLSDLQVSRINNWLESERLDQDSKENLEQVGAAISKTPENDMKELDILKSDQKLVTFMIDELEKELNK